VDTWRALAFGLRVAPLAACGCGIIVGGSSIQLAAGAADAGTDADDGQADEARDVRPEAVVDASSEFPFVENGDAGDVGPDGPLHPEVGAQVDGDGAPPVDPQVDADGAPPVDAGDGADGDGTDIAGFLVLVSVSTADVLGRFSSDSPAVSGDGTRVVFSSLADNLVLGDTNNTTDVFLRTIDLTTGAGQTVRLSALANGTQADAPCFDPDIGADGQTFVFLSATPNLTLGKSPGIHVLQGNLNDHQFFDRSPEVADRAWGPAVSSLGTDYTVVYGTATAVLPSDTNGTNDVYAKWRNNTELISTVDGADGVTGPAGNGISGSGSGSGVRLGISANADRVVFESDATNLVADDTNGVRDVFVRIRSTRRTLRVSTTSATAADGGGAEGHGASRVGAISADGRVASFESVAEDLVPNDTNGHSDVFVHDIETGMTEIVSVASDGTPSDQDSYFSTISGDGRVVAFVSSSKKLDPDSPSIPGGQGEYNVFVHDRTSRKTFRVTRPAGDPLAMAGSVSRPAISANGKVVVFSTEGAFVAADTNYKRDVYAFIFTRAPWLK
jgi:Tol biopolymer transport system component